MTTLCIPNWDKWQSYRKDRGTPPWIKIHRNLLSSPKWAVLTDAEKGQLVSIWIVAADKGGVIADNPRIIKKICQLDTEPNINNFIELGFLSGKRQPDDNQVTTTRPQHDPPETETETETETDKRQNKSIGQNEFDRWWSEYPKKVGKKPAKAIWKRIKPDADVLIADAQKRLAGDSQWREGFIPNPTTYLNQERWNDELQQPKRAELTEDERVGLRQQRAEAILSAINGGNVGDNGAALPSPMDEDEWGDRGGHVSELG